MKYRTVFLSDVHLGSRGCQAELLLGFLRETEASTFYLVGDVFDGWSLRRGWHWPQAHNDVLQAFLAKAHAGSRIIFIPGNHDEVMRAYLGTHFGGIEVMERAEFAAPDGRRYLVTHGDQFDAVVVNARWLAHVGDRAYEVALWLNTWLNRARRLWGGQYWSLSNWAKQQVKQAVNYIGDYETVVAAEARRGGYDGVICGHIHAAQRRVIAGVDYVNTGDWTESCTAVVERDDGALEILDWTVVLRQREALRARRASPSGRRAGARTPEEEAA